MKCLVVGPRSPDHLVSCLWDGLQEVLGEENVVDAVDNPWLHKSSLERLRAEQAEGERQFGFPLILQSIAGTKEGKSLRRGDDKDFDLIILASSFNRDQTWEWVREFARKWLNSKGKVAYLEGWDAAWQIEAPQMPVDAYFRKEISPCVSYPMPPHHLTFAAPARWIYQDVPRSYDVVFVGNPSSGHPDQLDLRWRMLSETFKTKRKHASVIATRGIGHEKYFDLLRSSKLALCPTAADSSDSLRTYEAAACGAIPVFVGYPNYDRNPWFPPETCFNCTVETLAAHLDEALSHDLTPMRLRLWEHTLQNHTTRARALKVLDVLGFKRGTDF